MMHMTDFLSGAGSILAEAAAPGGASGGSPLSGILWMVLLMVGMYFLLIAPQRKAQKQHQKLVNEIKKGDRIITKGGFYGKVLSVKKDRVTLQLGENTKVELVRSAIGSVVSKEEAESSSEEESAES